MRLSGIGIMPKRRLSNHVARISALALAGLAIVSATALSLPASASSTAGASALITIDPTGSVQTQPTGAAQSYQIHLSCSGVTSSCGPNSTIRIPLKTSTTPPMDGGKWGFSASTSTSGLITGGPTIDGTDLVINLADDRFVAGYSGSILLKITPPNGITPNNTTWSVHPSVSGDNITTVTAPTPSESKATASPQTSVAKQTADGGSVYEVGSEVTYLITAKCTSPSTGNLFVNSGSIVDTLPAGVTYVSSEPAGASVSGQTVTWRVSKNDLATMPAGCAEGATGPTSYKVVVRMPNTTTGSQLVNAASFSGTGPDAEVPAGKTSTSNASVPVALVTTPNVGPGLGYAGISKTSLAPLAQGGISSGNQYVATYPGDWLPLTQTPSYKAGAAAASYQTTVSYGLVGAYETKLIDPLPCIDTYSGTGNVYPSSDYTNPSCSNLAFHSQYFNVYSPGYDTSVNGLGRAYANGWRPQLVIQGNPNPISLNATASVATTATSANFKVPSGDEVIAIILPTSAQLKCKTLQLSVWGYADASLLNLHGNLVSELKNIATAIPEYPAGTPLQPVQNNASIFTVPPKVGLGISKSFGALGAASGGGTELTMVGQVSSPTALVNTVVLTDLLPTAMQWLNPITSLSVSLTQGSQTAIKAAATVDLIRDYENSGRQLIRITIPASAFTTAGSWKITLPTGAIRVTVPTSQPAIYPNTDQIFLYNFAPQQITQQCTTPTQTSGGISTATFENDNSQDLAGDGQKSENYCQNSASLQVKGSGPAMALIKTVQGDLDSVPRGALGVGNVTPGSAGYADYTLTWANVGSDTLANPVIYDILPFVGDTGVSKAQASVPRDSQFAPTFVSVGTLPSNIAVSYSVSSNPCRGPVYSQAPDCVDDWSPSLPSPPSLVRALRFSAVNAATTYPNGSSFAVSVRVTIPANDLNRTAWNSAATNATDVTSPSSHPLPAEPPKVGIRATSPPVFDTTASTNATTVDEPLVDHIHLSGVGSSTVEVTWTLYGPLAPIDGSCRGLDWAGAPVSSTGTKTWADGDGNRVLGPTNVGLSGCYSWGYELVDADYSLTPDVIYPGKASETTLVTKHTPSIETHASVMGSTPTKVYDNVTITKSGVGISPHADATATLTWQLVGPVPAVNNACRGVSWTQAPQVATGTISITRDGTYKTPATAIGTHGCYSFIESLDGSIQRDAVVSGVGKEPESIRLPLSPTPTPQPKPLPDTGWNAAQWSTMALVLVAAGLLSFGLRRRRA
jgi:Domain of unknown function DUF11